ncbi:MAG: cysteine-rich CWC family protein [Deltaproteobacteria bacterium]|nr:MAG: cysteine-rich CWC family protein [Deltaproteobacteria bacterium]
MDRINRAKCPLCGEPNQCALAADPTATECWCDSAAFPEELLAQIPDAAVRKICVCQKCLAKFDESVDASDRDL